MFLKKFCQIIRIYTFKPKNIQKSPNFFVEKGNIPSPISSFSKNKLSKKDFFSQK
jgi:hypothetical protein